jgi:hypothetical protein
MQAYPLTDLSAALLEAGYYAPRYRDAYETARSARIATKRGNNDLWTFGVDYLPVIADRLGLTTFAAA